MNVAYWPRLSRTSIDERLAGLAAQEARDPRQPAEAGEAEERGERDDAEARDRSEQVQPAALRRRSRRASASRR